MLTDVALIYTTNREALMKCSLLPFCRPAWAGDRRALCYLPERAGGVKGQCVLQAACYCGLGSVLLRPQSGEEGPLPVQNAAGMCTSVWK